jgi:hypothetical protein
VVSGSGIPVLGERLRQSLKVPGVEPAADIRSATTYADGAVVFCGVTTEGSIVLPDGSSSTEFVLRRGEVVVRTFMAGRR